MPTTCIHPFALLVAAHLLHFAFANDTFSRLEAGSKCTDYHIPDVPSKEECFSIAAPALGLSSALKMQINGIGFNGCAFNTVANILIYSVTPAATPDTHMVLPTLQYICNGVPTTTTTATTTATTGTSTSTSAIFAKLGPGSRCSDEGVPDVPSKEACFNAAMGVVGLGGTMAMELNNLGFTGCVFNSAANMLMYGTTTGVSSESNMKLPTFEYVCNGIPTTTTTTTATMTATTMTTTTATTTTAVYTKMMAGQRCGNIPAVPSKEACFGAAASYVGLSGKLTIEVNFMGFTGCVYNAFAGVLMYGVTPGITPATTMALPTLEYVCEGFAPPLFP